MKSTSPSALAGAIGCVDKIFVWAQFFGLVAIGVASLVCFVLELWEMIASRNVNLGGLLLLFLYTEVVVMARAAMHSNHELTIVMPIAIAVVAIGRYMVVGSDHDSMHQLFYAGAIFVLVAALFIWYIRRRAAGINNQHDKESWG